MRDNKIILLLAMCMAFTSAVKVPTSRALLDSHAAFEGNTATASPGQDSFLQFHEDSLSVKLIDAKAASSSSFLQFNKTFCRGPIYVTQATDTSLDDCRKDCMAKQCTAYSYCDPKSKRGCDVHTYPSSTEDASTENFPAGTCIITSGETGVGMLEQAPGWTCGAANVTFICPGGPGGSGGCNVQKETFILFANEDMKTLQAYPNTATVDDCCGACKSEEGCNFFWYCRSDTSSCGFNFKDKTGNTQSFDGGKFQPGTCALLQANVANGLMVPVVGDNPFDSGTPSTTNPNPKSGGDCSVVKDTFAIVPQSAGLALMTYQAGSADECCSYCKQGQVCNLFQYCHSDASSCDFQYTGQDGSTGETNFGSKVPPGLCALYTVYDTTAIQTASGDAVPWDYGTVALAQ